MMNFFFILGAGLLGVVGHWLNRWVSGRTESTFMQYMGQYKANSISAVFSVVTSSSTIFASLPEDVHGKPLMMVILASYTTAYMLDSMVNKDKTPPIQPELVKLKRTVDSALIDLEDDKKTLADIVRDDAGL